MAGLGGGQGTPPKLYCPVDAAPADDDDDGLLFTLLLLLATMAAVGKLFTLLLLLLFPQGVQFSLANVDCSTLVPIDELMKLMYWCSLRAAINELRQSLMLPCCTCLICLETFLQTRREILLDRRPTVWTVCSTGSSLAETGTASGEAKRG